MVLRPLHLRQPQVRLPTPCSQQAAYAFVAFVEDGVVPTSLLRAGAHEDAGVEVEVRALPADRGKENRTTVRVFMKSCLEC